MIKRTLTIGAILLLAGTLAVPVLAQGPGWGRGGGMGGYGPGACWNQAGPYPGGQLTAEQQSKVEELQRSHYEATAETRSQLQAKQAEMRALMTAETVDEARVKALQKEINTLRADLSEKRVELALELRKISPNARFAGGYGPGGYGHRGYGHHGWGRGGGRHMMGGGFGSGYGPGACWY